MPPPRKACVINVLRNFLSGDCNNTSFRSKSAFTLAETLITIGIIGVIAVLVIPPIINKYQEIVTVNKVKKFDSMMSQAIALSILENGSPENWDNKHAMLGGSQLTYSKYIKPYIKVVDDCVEEGLKEDNKSYAETTDCSLQVPSDKLYLSGEKWSTNYNTTQYAKFRTSDGMDAWMRTSSGGKSRNDHLACSNDEPGDKMQPGDICAVFWVDVNGFNKKPNQYGKDIFHFKLRPTGHFNVPVRVTSTTSNPDCYLNDQGSTCSKWIIEHSNMKYPKTKSTNDQ